MQKRDIGEATITAPLKHFRAKLYDASFEVCIRAMANVLWFFAFVKNGFQYKRILCYPEVPQFYHMLYLGIRASGYRPTNNPSLPHEIVYAYKDTTTYTPDTTLTSLGEIEQVINKNCTNIGKLRVEEVFTEVFGYSSHVDPRTHVGRCVKKSIRNSAHDGMLISCPAEPEEGYIYQKLIDTTDKDLVIDTRVLLFEGRSAPFVVYKTKHRNDRFDHTCAMKVVPTDTYLSSEEKRKISLFGERFGLTLGELDVLRDKNDGRLYIIDANNTPSIPLPGRQISFREFFVFLSNVLPMYRTVFSKREYEQVSPRHSSDKREFVTASSDFRKRSSTAVQ